MEKINEVIAGGRLIGISDAGAGTKSFVLAVKSNDRSVYPRFNCKEEMLAQFKIRDRIHVEGHMEVLDRFVAGAFARDQVFIADKILPEKTMCELRFGIKGRFFGEHGAIANIRGIVTAVRQDGFWYRYRIDIGAEGKQQIVNVSFMVPKNGRNPRIYEGDEVCMSCVISTVEKKTSDGKKRIYTDLIARDFAIADASGRKPIQVPKETGKPEEKKDSVSVSRKPVVKKVEKKVSAIVHKENMDDKKDNVKENIPLKDIDDALKDDISDYSTGAINSKEETAEEDKQKEVEKAAKNEAAKKAAESMMPEWMKS